VKTLAFEYIHRGSDKHSVSQCYDYDHLRANHDLFVLKLRRHGRFSRACYRPSPPLDCFGSFGLVVFGNGLLGDQVFFPPRTALILLIHFDPSF